jgi:hypothetical protein
MKTALIVAAIILVIIYVIGSKPPKDRDMNMKDLNKKYYSPKP